MTSQRTTTRNGSLTLPLVIRTLAKHYDPPKSFLHHRNPFKLLVATILSAQCTDDRVNRVTPKLFRHFRTPRAFAEAPLADIIECIRSVTYFQSKARYIQRMSQLLLERHGGQVPQTMEELTALPGVGRKTATIVLYAAFDKIEGIAVDTHVLRLAKRMGFTKSRDPKRVELDLMTQAPCSSWARINPLLISHGRAVCTARNRRCSDCVFQRRCPSSAVVGKPDRAAL